MNSSNTFLDIRNIVKTFPGVRALDGVSFDLRQGEVHALVGENGAGKSTLMHILGGVYQPDSGEVRIDGCPVKLPTPHHAAEHGISVVFQELSLSENLSIAENVFANRQPVKGFGLVDWDSLYRQTSDVLSLFGWEIDPRTLVRDLPTAMQQVVEILKAIARQPRVLILDEPTSSLTTSETDLLFANIRRLKSEGMSFIYITHRMAEVFELADRVTVLRDGRHVDTCDASSVTEDDLVRKMVGRELVDMYGCRETEPGEVRLELSNARREGAFEEVSFAVRSGEIVGIAGLAGAGRTELGRAVFGAEPIDGGSIALNGRPISVRSTWDAIEHRIAYLSEDRKYDGLFLDMSIRDNVVAPSLRRFTNASGLMDDPAITRTAEDCCDRFNVATPSAHQQVGLLSGGNQQKVLLAMWIGIRPLVLIADEPTRGVDVGAKSEIYHRLRELAAEGVAIIVISSDLPEILGLSDRILVMREGRIAGEFARADATEEKIIACASGLCNG